MMRNQLACLALALLIASALVSAQEAPQRGVDPKVTPEQVAQGCTGPGPTMAAPRMADIPQEKMTDAQKVVAAEFNKIRGSEARGVFGPYVAILRSPEQLVPVVTLGSYLQFKSPLPEELKQFIIAITARQWSMQYMWNVHCPGAVRAGLNPAIAKQLLNGERPTGMSDNEALVYDFLDQLHRNQSVSDTLYAKALDKFGEQGILDMVGTNAYYTYLAMVGNVARLPVGKGTKPNLPGMPY